MEEDDEFGDLYTDVLLPFSQSSSSSFASQPHQLSSSAAPSSVRPPIDLNLQTARSYSNSGDFVFPRTNQSVVRISKELEGNGFDDSGRNLAAGDVREENLPDRGVRILDVDGGKKLESGNDVDLMENDMKFDIEDAELEPIIPGISGGGNLVNSGRNGEGVVGNGGEGDDWDSDSEDDLQIVLNDNNHGPMGVERGGIVGGDDDVDGELVIVADGDPNQAMEEQEWGEDSKQAPDGERKEGGAVPKGNGGMMVMPKTGYGNPGYHPFHSQFKYIRPGAAPIPGAAPMPGGAPMPGSATAVPGGTPIQVGPMAGRGRGDWRPAGIKSAPPMQKGFNSGFGVPVWGAGHNLGSGLEFTLPSHKTIFEVDINGFEQKPWKYPGVDTSDFFNFGLNEESWKDYCKQVEQLRLESTMQSKIRVYESGRTEQEYDPDLPPELAAAAGMHDVQAQNEINGKSEIGESDLAKGFARGRPVLPTGRAIQVEGGYGERLPSIDTRPPRNRDSESIIEIVCEDSVDDDSSAGNGVLDRPLNNSSSREDLRRGRADEDDIAPVEMEYLDEYSQSNNSHKRELIGRRVPLPFKNNVGDNMPEGDGTCPIKTPVQRHPGSRGQSPMYPGVNFASHEERRIQGRAWEKSPLMNSRRNTEDKKFLENQREESVESMDGKHSPLSSSPVTVGVAEESSVDHTDAVVPDEHVTADGISGMENEEMATNAISNTLQDGDLLESMKIQNLSCQAEPRVQELWDKEDSKEARSSENSKARSGSSRDYEKWQDGVEEEVIQVGRSGSTKVLLDNERSLQRKREGRQEIERNQMVVKRREDSYSHGDWDPSSANHVHFKTAGFNRQERENPDGAWQRRDDDPRSRRIRIEDKRKREFDDEMGSRLRGKVRESERGDKGGHLLSRKQLDNGSHRIHYDKDVTTRLRERDDNLKKRYENVDDYRGKRRKEEEYLRDQTEKKEFLHEYRESTNHRRREREEIVDQRKRDDQLKSRDIIDDYHHSIRHKDESLLHRERGDRPREREEWHRQKQSHEGNLSKRGKEGQGTLKSAAEDKAWIGHARVKDGYKGSEKDSQSKNTIHHNEQPKRRDHTEDEILSHQRGRVDVYARGNKFTNEERKSRQERSNSRNDGVVNAFDNPRPHERKHKEGTRKNTDSEGGDHNSSKRNQEDESGHVNKMGIKGTGGRANVESHNSDHHHNSREHKDHSSDDEEQDSRKGRSKLERWTSQLERDFSINSKTSSSLKFKEVDINSRDGSSEPSKRPYESSQAVQADGNQKLLAEAKDSGDHVIKNASVDDRHTDTVEKLKKRSERFKLPMPSEKEASVIRMTENEAPPSAKSETPAESEIKHERPVRKRRWINN